MTNIEKLIEGMSTHRDVIELFITINKAEGYLYEIKKTNDQEYYRLKNEASSLKDSEADRLIYDCIYTEEPKLVRHVINCIDVSGIKSDFEYGLKKIEGLRLRYWRDLLRNAVDIDPEDYLLHLNYFTLFTARTGGEVNMEMLNNFAYLKGQFIREKTIGKLINFKHANINDVHNIKINRTGNFDKIELERSNKALEDRINTLLGV